MSLENQENNQTFIEKIDADILKELESIQDSYNFFNKAHNKDQWIHYADEKRTRKTRDLFEKFVNEFKQYSNKEINGLMMEILESENINEIKDKTMIIYNIILSNNLNKEFGFKIEKVDNELIEENERRAKNRQWYKDKITFLLKLIEYIIIIAICSSPFIFIYYCLYYILLIPAINLIMGLIGTIIVFLLLFILLNFMES